MNRLKLFLVLLVIAVMVFLYHHFFRETLISDKQINVDKDQIEIKPVDVSVQKAFTGDLIKYADASGITEAVKQSVMKSLVSASIDSVYVMEGQNVKKGDTLVVLNNVNAKADLDAAESRLIEARGQYLMLLREGVDTSRTGMIPDSLSESFSQAEKDYENCLISLDSMLAVKRKYEFELLASGGQRKQLLTQRSGLKVAESAFRKAKYYYDHCVVRAPYGGIISSVRARTAEFVNMGMDLLTIVDLNQMKINLNLLESDLGYVKRGDSIYVKFTAYGDELFPGIVKGIDPIVDSLSRTAAVTAVLMNSSMKINPGCSVLAELP